MKPLTASDVLGMDRLMALRAEGKDDAAISEEVYRVLEPIKQRLGEDVYQGFRKQGVDIGSMKQYVGYLDAEAIKEANRKEEEAYARQVENAKQSFKREYSGTGFKDRLDRGVGRVLTELDVVGHAVAGVKPPAERLGFLAADDEIASEYEKAHRTPQEQKVYEEKERAFEDANGTLETIKTGADMLFQKVKNPSEWDIAGLVAEGINPVNYVGAGAGTVISKVGTKVGTKVVVAGATGALADAAAGAEYDYTLARAKGADEETAKKAATLGVAANLGMGAVSGSLAGLVHSKLKAKKAALLTGESPTAQEILGTDETLMGTEELGKALEADSAAKEALTLPDEIETSRIMQLSEAEEHASAAHDIIMAIDEKVPDAQAREAMIAQRLPPTEKEISLSHVINDNHDVSPSMVGARAAKKLEVAIANADKYTPEKVSAKLDSYGITGEHKRAMMRAFEAKDMDVYNQWASDRYLNKMEESYATDRDRGENTTGEADRADDGTAGAGTGAEPHAEQNALADAGRGDQQTRGYNGQDPWIGGESDGVPAVDGALARQQSTGGAGEALHGAREEPVVSTKDGLSPQQTLRSIKQQIASVESRGSYTAKNPTSSAYGKYQFLRSTYAEAARALGMTDREVRTPAGQERAMAWLVEKNTKALKARGIEPTAFHVYGAHQQGLAGFTRILRGKPTQKDLINMRNNTPKRYRTGHIRDDWMKFWSGKFKDGKYDPALAAKMDALPQDAIGRAEAIDAEVGRQVDDLLTDEPETRWADEAQRVEDGIAEDIPATAPKEEFTLVDKPAREQAIDTLLSSPHQAKMTQTLGNVFREKVLNVLSFKEGSPVRRIVDNSTIKHIFKKHSNAKTEASRGLIPVTKRDIANYPEMVQSADFQTVLTYKGGKRKMVSVRQSKGHYVVVEEVSTKKNTLRLQTMYKRKGRLDERAINHILKDESHPFTARTDTVAYTVENMPSSTKSIAQSAEDVKSAALQRVIADTPEAIDTPTLHEGWDMPLDVEEIRVEIDDGLDFFDMPQMDSTSVLREMVDDVPLDAAHEKIIASERDPMKREALRAEAEGRKDIWDEEC